MLVQAPFFPEEPPLSPSQVDLLAADSEEETKSEDQEAHQCDQFQHDDHTELSLLALRFTRQLEWSGVFMGFGSLRLLVCGSPGIAKPAGEELSAIPPRSGGAKRRCW